MSRRLVIFVGALAVGVMFTIGLFIQSWVGGVLLLVTAAILVSLTRFNWASQRRQAQVIRVLIIGVIAGVGIAKLIHN